MHTIDVSPEQIKENRYTESREMQDGWQYQLDAKGNVMKDSKGNDMKTLRYKTITCTVMENRQHKAARIAGTLDYIDNANGDLIKSAPLVADAFFNHDAAMAVGDLEALSTESRAKLGRSPIPFPDDFDMLLQAGNTLKGKVKSIIWEHCDLLQ